MANKYTRGATVVLALNDVRDQQGLPIVIDPTTVVVSVTDPTNVTTLYTLALAQVIKDSVGNYHYNLITAALADTYLGYWLYTWITTGTPQHAEKNTFILESEKTRP